jgi:hypothetical protein
LSEQKIRYDLPEFVVLVAQVTSFGRRASAHIVVTVSPPIKRRFGYPHFTAHLHRWRSGSYAPQRSYDLFFRELAWSHTAIAPFSRRLTLAHIITHTYRSNR